MNSAKNGCLFGEKERIWCAKGDLQVWFGFSGEGVG